MARKYSDGDLHGNLSLSAGTFFLFSRVARKKKKGKVFVASGVQKLPSFSRCTRGNLPHRHNDPLFTCNFPFLPRRRHLRCFFHFARLGRVMNIRSRRARWVKRCFNKSKKKARWRTSMEAALIFGGFIYRVEFFTRAAWLRRRCEAKREIFENYIYPALSDWKTVSHSAENCRRKEEIGMNDEMRRTNPIYNFKTFLPSLMELAKLIFSVTNSRSDYLCFAFDWRRKSRKISYTSHRAFLLSTEK